MNDAANLQLLQLVNHHDHDHRNAEHHREYDQLNHFSHLLR